MGDFMIRESYLNKTVKNSNTALTNVAQLVGHRPAKGMVTGSIPGQGTCLGSRFSPRSGHI